MHYKERLAQLNAEAISKIAELFLKSPLVPVEEGSYDDGEISLGAVRTKDGSFYFIPCLDDPVMSGPRLNGESVPVPGQFMWRIETPHYESNYPHEPDLVDIVEVEGDRSASLNGAVIRASHHLLDLAINNAMESEFGGIQGTLEEEYPNIRLGDDTPAPKGATPPEHRRSLSSLAKEE